MSDSETPVFRKSKLIKQTSTTGSLSKSGSQSGGGGLMQAALEAQALKDAERFARNSGQYERK